MPSAANAAESAIRNYLAALRDPASLRDDKKIGTLGEKLQQAGDEIERLRLRQELIEAQTPSVERFEEAFVEHAKAWSERIGISERAFLEEGVPPQVLRRAGFRIAASAGRGRRNGGARRSRVTAEEVRSAIPRGTFTIKRLQEATGASPAVVRKVVIEEEQAGRLSKVGTDPKHVGPGRSPSLYKRT